MISTQVALQKREHVVTREMLEIQMATQAEIEVQRQKDQRETEAARAAHRKRQEELAAEAKADRAAKHEASMAKQDEVKEMVAAMLPEIISAVKAEGSATRKKVEETARKGRRSRAVVSICGNSSSSDEDSASDAEETTAPAPVAAAKSPNAEQRAWPESKGVLPPQRLFEEGGSPTTGEAEAEAAGATLDDTTVEAQSPGFAERGTPTEAEADAAALEDDETVTQAPPREEVAADTLDEAIVAEAPPQGAAPAVSGFDWNELIECAQGRILMQEWAAGFPRGDWEKPRDPKNLDKIEMNTPHYLPMIARKKGIDLADLRHEL